jgi:class 3 adenylate cyclase
MSREDKRVAEIKLGDALRSPSLAPESTSTERRQLTVMFCDLVGSTEISASLDPEEESTVLRNYHRCCAKGITSAGGFVAQFQGDGVIGYFGYPQASENDAERAVRAALEVIELVPKIAPGLSIPIEVRVGISTGVAVVGDPERVGTRLEQTVIGDTINLAARLQSVAGANQVVIAESTKLLTRSLFACRNLGALAVKGFAEPIRAWQVLGPRTTRTSRAPVLTPIVGRKAEIDALLRRWRQTVAGDGQIVRVVAEAGIGKSRLIKEFHQRIAKERPIWVEGGGSQFFQHTPFYAISQMILRVLDPKGSASPSELRAKLARALRDAGLDSTQALPSIGELLGLSTPESLAPSMLAPSDRRDRLFDALAAWIHAIAQRELLVIVIEDLHWFDASSLELITRISKSSRPLRALVLLSMRAGFRPPFAELRGQHRIRLKQLPDDKLREIIANMATGGSPWPAEIVDRVVKRADGVPLFAVELVRLMMEQRGSTSDRRIPASLSDLLTARLDQLGSAKNIAQVAAVIGDEVSLPLLTMVSEVAEARLRSDLAKLEKAGLLQQTGSTADPIYSFKHSLLRDAAYESLLKSRRRELHRRTATLLRERFAGLPAARSELLAHHWTQAGEPHFAIKAWHQAGDSASARRAFGEAQQAYQAALSILLALPSSSDRDALELPLQGSLAEVLRITRGYAAPQTIAATTRARALSEKNGDIAQRFLQAVGAWAAASSSGEYLVARNLADQVLELALADRNRVSLAHAHMIQMTSRYRIGDLLGAEDYFERGEDLFNLPGFRKQPGWGAQTYGNAARNAWIMGDQISAQHRIDQALNIAQENDSPYDFAFAKYMAASHAVLIDSLDSAARFAENSVQLADKHGFPQFAAISRITLGRAMAGSGAPADGITLIRDGLAGMAATGSRVAITLYMTWLAEAELLDGRSDDSLRSAELALQLNPQELFFRPASLHLRGHLYARKGLPAKAEQDFREVMNLSTGMGAKLFRDRAAESLQRLTTAQLT